MYALLKLQSYCHPYNEIQDSSAAYALIPFAHIPHAITSKSFYSRQHGVIQRINIACKNKP